MTGLLAPIIHILGFLFALSGIYYANFISTDSYVIAYIIHIPSLFLIISGLIGLFLSNNHYKDVLEIFQTLIKKSNAKIWRKISYAENVTI